MSPTASSSNATDSELRQMARRPRESDGVGNALRQIFGGAPGVTSEFNALLSRLNKQD